MDGYLAWFPQEWKQMSRDPRRNFKKSCRITMGLSRFYGTYQATKSESTDNSYENLVAFNRCGLYVIIS